MIEGEQEIETEAKEEEERINKPKKNNGRLMHNKCKWWRILFALRIFLLATNAQTKTPTCNDTHPPTWMYCFFRSFFLCVCQRSRQCISVHQSVLKCQHKVLCLPKTKRKKKILHSKSVSINVNKFSVDLST